MYGKAALVTGASRGIGRAVALLLAREGYAVAVNYSSSPEAAGKVLQKIVRQGGTAAAVCADVSNPGQVVAMVREVCAGLGLVSLIEKFIKNTQTFHILNEKTGERAPAFHQEKK